MKNILLHNSPKLAAALAAVAMTFAGFATQAASVKSDPLATRGCIAKIPVEKANEIIARYKYELIGATRMETRSLGTTLTWIERLNGGKEFTPAVAREGYGVRFREKKGHSAQRSGEIAINRNGDLKYGENVAQLAHEIAHLVGNNGMYGDYRAAIGSTRRHKKFCKVSGYSDDKPNEQFAEVFAAFVTRPELIRDNHDPVCKKAYAFFKRVFARGSMADKCYDAQNDVKAKLVALADSAPSAKGAQSDAAKANGVRASQLDGKTKAQFLAGTPKSALVLKDAKQPSNRELIAKTPSRPSPLILAPKSPSLLDPALFEQLKARAQHETRSTKAKPAKSAGSKPAKKAASKSKGSKSASKALAKAKPAPAKSKETPVAKAKPAPAKSKEAPVAKAKPAPAKSKEAPVAKAKPAPAKKQEAPIAKSQATPAKAPAAKPAAPIAKAQGTQKKQTS